mgnify:FL=1
MRWLKLARGLDTLHLEHTLTNGQAFGWTTHSLLPPPTAHTHVQPPDVPHEAYVGVLRSSVVALRHTPCGDTEYATLSQATYSAAGDHEDLHRALTDLLCLDVNLEPLLTAWADADPRIAAVSKALPGMRVLRQDPTECLFSFICSSNNNIGRIGGMLAALRARYGEPIPLAAAVPASVA